MMTIESRVVCVIARKLRLQPDELELSASIARDLGADSLDAVEIVMEMEDEFGLDIPDEDAENLQTVRDICEYIERALLIER